MARYIDADNYIEYIEKNICGKCIDDVCGACMLDSGKTIAEAMPTADVEEVRHGEWLPQIVLGQKVWDCSECKTLGSPFWKRCPICEAKMDGGKAE